MKIVVSGAMAAIIAMLFAVAASTAEAKVPVFPPCTSANYGQIIFVRVSTGPLEAWQCRQHPYLGEPYGEWVYIGIAD